MRGYCWQQLRLVEIESLAQLKLEAAARKFTLRKTKLKNPRWLRVEVAAFSNRLENQAGLGGGGLKRRDETGF